MAAQTEWSWDAFRFELAILAPIACAVAAWVLLSGLRRVLAWAQKISEDIQDLRGDIKGMSQNASHNIDEPSFVNDALSFLWPHISNFAVETLVGTVEPAVNAALPKPLQGQLHFDPKTTSLGDVPPFFSTIRSTRTTQQSYSGDFQNLSLVGSICWMGNSRISSRFLGVWLGIEAVSLTGNVTIELVRMRDRPPMFSGVRIFFLDTPKVAFNFTGGAKVMNIGTLREAILEAIDKQIRSRVVVPNMVGFALDPKAEIFAIKAPRPLGVLEVVVHSAEGLVASDRNFLMKLSSSDPFVRLVCGADTLTSMVKPRTLNPTFEWKAYVALVCLSQVLHFTLLDKDLAGDTDFLGSLDISAKEMASWKGDRQKLDLNSESGESGHVGTVTLSATWLPLQLGPPQTHAKVALWHGGLCCVFAGLYAVENVPYAKAGTEFWVTAECTTALVGTSRPTQQESARLQHSPPPASATSTGAINRLRRRFSRLQKHGVPIDEAADILEVEKELLESFAACDGEGSQGCATPPRGASRTYREAVSSVLSSISPRQSRQSSRSPRGSTTPVATELGSEVGFEPEVKGIVHVCPQDITYDHPFIFFVRDIFNSKITLRLMRRLPSDKTGVELDKCNLPITSLVTRIGHTASYAAELPNTGASMRLRVQLRFTAEDGAKS
eukprot:TRINITY_DN23445_c0_g1_i1.p1 TRINITY_DN23445_c0_g1~~TRINITY_DN23445_c0_g1_i1.p1  ORF type:complete len:705 (+),score=113.37 TRINITY_DN23445_c0_g1_i1:116-2116(+)